MAKDGQQVLFFTCHEHIAHLFQKKNVEPLWLPGHKVAFDTMKPELEDHSQSSSGDSDTNSADFVANSDELLDERYETSADGDPASAI